MQHGHIFSGCVRGAACNLHTALALVAKMRGLGIQARCDTLVMQPTLAMQRRKQRRFQQQARLLGRTPRASCGVSGFQGAAGRLASAPALPSPSASQQSVAGALGCCRLSHCSCTSVARAGRGACSANDGACECQCGWFPAETFSQRARLGGSSGTDLTVWPCY